jgi:N-acetylmuramic acid 6-phosphate etherase
MVNLRTTNEKLKARSWTIVSQATSADAAAVDAALAAHSGDVKAAIVSLLTDAQPEAVRQALLATDGHVKQALAHLRDHKKTIS